MPDATEPVPRMASHVVATTSSNSTTLQSAAGAVDNHSDAVVVASMRASPTVGVRHTQRIRTDPDYQKHHDTLVHRLVALHTASSVVPVVATTTAPRPSLWETRQRVYPTVYEGYETNGPQEERAARDEWLTHHLNVYAVDVVPVSPPHQHVRVPLDGKRVREDREIHEAAAAAAALDHPPPKVMKQDANDHSPLEVVTADHPTRPVPKDASLVAAPATERAHADATEPTVARSDTEADTASLVPRYTDIWGRFPAKEPPFLIECSVCKSTKVNALRFASHLDKCMGIRTMSRTAATATK